MVFSVYVFTGYVNVEIQNLNLLKQLIVRNEFHAPY